MVLKLNQKGSFMIWFTVAFALYGTFIGFAARFRKGLPGKSAHLTGWSMARRSPQRRFPQLLSRV